MAYNYVTILNNVSLDSLNAEYNNNEVLDKECKSYINISLMDNPDETQRLSIESNGEANVIKLAELAEAISSLKTKPGKNFVNDWFGLIYFKTEKDGHFPILSLHPELRDFFRQNFPKAILRLEGEIQFSDDYNNASKRFRKSWNFQEEIRPLTLTPPFPLDMLWTIENCYWSLRSFSISIGLEDEKCLGKKLKLNSNDFMQKLFGEEGTQPKDFILVAANGTEIPCHGFIVGAQSPALAAMVNPSGGAMKESGSKRIELKMFSEETLKTFVSFIYCQDVSLEPMDCDTALGLFRLGHMYQLPQLPKAVSELMLEKGKAWFTANSILEVYYLVKNLEEFKELTDHVLAIMVKLSDAVRQCEAYQELDTKEASELPWILLNKAKNA